MYNYPLEMPLTAENEQENNLSMLSQKLEHMRRISNVIQALDNLASQCADEPSLNAIKAYAEYQLGDLRQELKQQIHS